MCGGVGRVWFVLGIVFFFLVCVGGGVLRRFVFSKYREGFLCVVFGYREFSKYRF